MISICADSAGSEQIQLRRRPLRRCLPTIGDRSLVNQLGKFSTRIAEISQTVRELLRSDRAWVWGPDQQKVFEAIKQELVKPTVLALYNPEAETKVSADASSYGLGAVLLQQNDGNWKPVAYASRSLSDTERRYAQIEKEALASTWVREVP